jgi:hypothetical protein
MQVKLTDFGHAVRLPETDVESPIRDQLTQDFSQLACVFYQMATCDFSAEALDLPETAVQIACAERGYSRQVSDIICSLLPLRTPSSLSEAAQTLRMPEEPLDAEDMLSELEEAGAGFTCYLCASERPAEHGFACGHRVCLSCQQAMREHGILECSICGSNTSSPRYERIFLPVMEFPDDFFRDLNGNWL